MIKFLQFILLISFISTLNLKGQNSYLTLKFEKKSIVLDRSMTSRIDSTFSNAYNKNLSFIKIYSYTDTTGLEKDNDLISKSRALTVYNYLTSKLDFDSSKIYVEWLGKSNETYDLHFSHAHAQQNCVDILIFLIEKSNKDN
jgi:outer membrane protein OmpA-like peptidoglycan-associated protein